SAKYGGFDEDILGVFYDLSESKFERLLKTYKFLHGIEAADYARRMYPLWQLRRAEPSSEVIERIMEILPRVLDFNAQCFLLRKLRERFRKRESYELEIDSSNWMDIINPLVQQIVSKAYTTELPATVQERLKWLSLDD